MLLLLLLLQPLNRMEFYIELIDDDRGQQGEENNELVDRFVIPINNKMSENTYSGLFGLASIHLSLNVHCSEFYFGDSCEQVRPITAMDLNPATTPPSISSSESDVTAPLVATFLLVILFILTAGTIVFAIVCGYFKKKIATLNIESNQLNRTVPMTEIPAMTTFPVPDSAVSMMKGFFFNSLLFCFSFHTTQFSDRIIRFIKAN